MDRWYAALPPEKVTQRAHAYALLRSIYEQALDEGVVAGPNPCAIRVVSGALSQYSDPPVSFELHKMALTNGARVVVLEVAEFEHDIHICRETFEGVLQDGQTYVRPRGKRESVPVPSSADARELHNLAIDKGVREFVRRAGAAGIPFGQATAPDELEARAYAAEVETGWREPNPVNQPDAAALGAWVTTPGYTDVAVRPGPTSPTG